MTPLSCVVVECVPHGSSSFACSTADCFQPDELTISCTDVDFDKVHGPLRVFAPGTWSNATVFDAQGNVQYLLSSAYQLENEVRFQAALAACRERRFA